jgi:hypothetical protein
MAAGSLDLLVKRVLPSWSVTESSLRGQGPHPQRAEVRLPVALALYPADLATIQKLAEHSDPATTARYDRPSRREGDAVGGEPPARPPLRRLTLRKGG